MKNPEIDILFQILMSKVDRLIIIWNDHHKGEDLSHFDGFFSMSYISPKVLEDAVSIIKEIYDGNNSENLKNRIKSTQNDLNDINNCYNEYLYFDPPEISNIAYKIEKIFSKCIEGDLFNELSLKESLDSLKHYI